MITIPELLRRVAALSKRSGLAESTLSFRLFDDGKRVAALRGGCDLRTKTLTAAEAKLRDLESRWPPEEGEELSALSTGVVHG